MNSANYVEDLKNRLNDSVNRGEMTVSEAAWVLPAKAGRMYSEPGARFAHRAKENSGTAITISHPSLKNASG